MYSVDNKMLCCINHVYDAIHCFIKRVCNVCWTKEENCNVSSDGKQASLRNSERIRLGGVIFSSWSHRDKALYYVMQDPGTRFRASALRYGLACHTLFTAGSFLYDLLLQEDARRRWPFIFSMQLHHITFLSPYFFYFIIAAIY